MPNARTLASQAVEFSGGMVAQVWPERMQVLVQDAPGAPNSHVPDEALHPSVLHRQPLSGQVALVVKVVHARQVAAVNAPILHDDLPLTIYPELQAGWHVDPDERVPVQSPMAPFAGGVVAWHEPA